MNVFVMDCVQLVSFCTGFYFGFYFDTMLQWIYGDGMFGTTNGPQYRMALGPSRVVGASGL